MKKEAEEIRKKFDGKLIGSEKMQELVCETISVFPKDIVDFVTNHVWFVGSFDDAWGFVLKVEELNAKGKYLVFLGDELFEQDHYSQKYEIAHEIGHVILKHRNAILKPQTKEEIACQEKEAHEFAIRYVGRGEL